MILLGSQSSLLDYMVDPLLEDWLNAFSSKWATTPRPRLEQTQQSVHISAELVFVKI